MSDNSEKKIELKIKSKLEQKKKKKTPDNVQIKRIEVENI